MPIETYQERMARERAREALAQAKRDARVQEIAAQQQRDQAWQAEQAARQAEIEKQQRERNAKLERLRSGEEAFDRASMPTFEQVMRESTEAVNARQKQERRELEASPEHQRFVEDPGWLQTPAARVESVKQYFASQHEPTVDESYSALQDAKATVAREEKQLKALQSGRVLSPGELPYQQQRLEQAKQQEQQALIQFNELAGVPHAN